MLPGDRLCLSDEPLKSFLTTLDLQFLPNHVPAGLVVAVEPVTLQGEKEGHHTVTEKLHRPTVRGPGAMVTAERKDAHNTLSFCSWIPDICFPGKIP